MTTINLSQLSGRSVMDVASAATIGRVDSGIIDAKAGRVVALSLSGTDADGVLLPWTSVKAIGPDAVTVESGEVLQQPEGPLEERGAAGDTDPFGKLLLDDGGKAHGTVSDLVVDEASGEICAVVAGEETIEAPEFLGSGDYAVVITRY